MIRMQHISLCFGGKHDFQVIIQGVIDDQIDENDYKFDLLSCTNKKGILQVRKIFVVEQTQLLK